jgi:hypothetical protein
MSIPAKQFIIPARFSGGQLPPTEDPGYGKTIETQDFFLLIFRSSR